MDWIGYLRIALGITVLVAAATAVLRGHGVRVGWSVAIAIARAIVQLAAISVLLGAVLQWPALIAVFLLLMLSTATFTGARRASGLPKGRGSAVVGIAAGGASATVLPLILGLVPLDVQQVIAIAGIAIGNAMSASTLTARKHLAAARANVGEIEGMLALGATPSQASSRIRRMAVHEALIPTLDQTRNTGLVTLPGAFVGALFGGLSPLGAGIFQVTVLAAVLLAQALSATILSAIVGRSPVLPAPERTPTQA